MGEYRSLARADDIAFEKAGTSSPRGLLAACVRVAISGDPELSIEFPLRPAVDLFGTVVPVPPSASPRRGAGDDAAAIPLAERLRPRTIEDVIGQSQLLGPGKPLRVAFASHRPHSDAFLPHVESGLFVFIGRRPRTRRSKSTGRCCRVRPSTC